MVLGLWEMRSKASDVNGAFQTHGSCRSDGHRRPGGNILGLEAVLADGKATVFTLI